jgi:hypothetical protein
MGSEREYGVTDVQLVAQPRIHWSSFRTEVVETISKKPYCEKSYLSGLVLPLAGL